MATFHPKLHAIGKRVVMRKRERV